MAARATRACGLAVPRACRGVPWVCARCSRRTWLSHRPAPPRCACSPSRPLHALRHSPPHAPPLAHRSCRASRSSQTTPRCSRRLLTRGGKRRSSKSHFLQVRARGCRCRPARGRGGGRWQAQGTPAGPQRGGVLSRRRALAPAARSLRRRLLVRARRACASAPITTLQPPSPPHVCRAEPAFGGSPGGEPSDYSDEEEDGDEGEEDGEEGGEGAKEAGAGTADSGARPGGA